MTTLNIGDPVTICLGTLAVRHAVVDDITGSYVVDGERFTGGAGAVVSSARHQLAVGHLPLNQLVDVGALVVVPPDAEYERDACPKCGAFRLTRGYGLGFGPGIGVYEYCDVDGCGHRTFEADTFDIDDDGFDLTT